MAEKRTYHAVYITQSDADTEPLALFKHADAAQQWRKQHYGDQGMVVAADIVVGGNSAVSDQLAATDASPVAGAGVDQLRAQIRAEVQERRTRERLRREIEAELDEEDAKAEDGRVVELREPAGPTSPPGGAGTAPNDPLATVNPEQAAELRKAGYGDADAIRRAGDEDLLKVPTVGQAAVKRLREATAQ